MALKSKAKGFVYKPRTVDQVKGRASRKNSKFDSIFKQGFDTYRPKQGDNLFRYLPPSWDDADHYGYTAHVHRNIGPDNSTYLCPRKMLNKPCPVCEAAKEAKDAGEADEAKELGTSERIVSFVLDRDGDDPEKPLLYDQSWTQDRDIVSLCVNERTGEILMVDHPDKGFDVTIKRTGTGMRTKYYGYAIARDDSPIHDDEKVQDEILDYVKSNQVPDTFQFYDYEYLKGVLSGTVAAKDEVLDKDEDEEEVVTKPKAKRAPVVEEDEEEVAPKTVRRGPRRDEELDEEEEAPVAKPKAKRQVVEEEEDETPPPRRSTRKPEPEPEPEPVDEEDEEDEEVDEEAEEETPVRRSTASAPARNARPRVVEEEDEEEEAPSPRSTIRPSSRRA